jgi:chemotaxis protein methyltransferase CheR
MLGASDPPIAELVACEVVVTDQTTLYRRAREAAAGTGRYTAVQVVAEPPPPATAHQDARVLDAGMAAEHARALEAFEALGREPAQVPDVAAERAGDRDAGRSARQAYREGDYEAADALAASAIEDGGADPAFWILRVRALANLGQLRDAGRVCLTAMERHPLEAELLYLHAVLLGETGRHKEALDAARRALYLDPGLIVAHIAYADASQHAGRQADTARALRNAARLLEGMPRQAEVAGTDGERAGRLAELVRLRLELVEAP